MKPTMSVETSVLIVGAGPSGLALAIELGHRSIPCIVIERNDRVGHAPRAKTTNVRTREHFRRWGIADKLRDASPLGLDYPSNVVFVTRLGGSLLTRIENAAHCAPGKNPLYSEHAQWIPQYTVEQVMRDHAMSLPSVDLRFGSELISMQQTCSGVVATVKDLANDVTLSIRGDYLVGADGARSTVRTAIGATMNGTRGLSRNYNVVFRSPGLAQAHPHGPAIMFWQINADIPSLIGPMDRDDKWYFMPMQVPQGRKISAEDAPALIRQSTGIDLPVEVLSVDEWVASRMIADKYRDRRAFLIGDACHLHPPFGGYGMNMGVSDGVDLGWKMAAVLQGWGSPALLASYENERRPVHEFVMDEAVANHSLLGKEIWHEGLEDATDAGEKLRSEVGARIRVEKMREFNTLKVVLGYRYDGSPIVLPDGTDTTVQGGLDYVPSARPGSLAPHAWLRDGTSLYDHFGSGFTLLVTDGADAAAIAWVCQVALAIGVPLKVVRPDDPVVRQLYSARYVLIRPDQHVAWRADAWPDELEHLFHVVCGGGPVSAPSNAQ